MDDLPNAAVLGAVSGAVGVAVLSWLMAKTSKGLGRSANRFVLSYGVVARSFAVLTVLGLPAIVLTSYWQGRAGADVSIAVMAFALLVGGYLLLEFYFVRIEYDSERVYTFSPWRRPRVIPWSSFHKRRYSATMSWHSYTTVGFGTLRVSDWLQGARDFDEQFQKSRGSS